MLKESHYPATGQNLEGERFKGFELDFVDTLFLRCETT